MSVHYFSYEEQQTSGRMFTVQYYSEHSAGGNEGGEEKKHIGRKWNAEVAAVSAFVIVLPTWHSKRS